MNTSLFPSKIKTGKFYIFAIIIFASILRVIYYHQISQTPEYTHLILDPQFNDYWAKRIIHGPSYPSPTGEDPMIETTPYGRPPAYPYLLSFLYLLFGESLFTTKFIQTLVGICNSFLTFLLTKNLFNHYLPGIISALLFSTLWQPIYFEQEINYPSWLTTVELVLIWFFYKYLKTGKRSYLIPSGIILGLFALFRPNALILYIPSACFIIYKNTQNLRKLLHALLTYTFAIVLTISPILIRNYLVSKEFFLISCFGGINIYIGNNPYSTGDSPSIPQITELCGMDNWSCFNYRYLVAGLGLKQRGTPFTFSEASKFFYKKSIDFWKNQPLKALKLTLRKFFLFWGPNIVSDGKVIQCEIENTILKYLPGFPLLLALFLFSALCFLLGHLPKLSDIESELFSFLFLSIIFYSFSVIPFFISERYRFPLIPFITVFSSGTIYRVLTNYSLLSNRQTKFIIALILVLCTIISQIPIVPYSPDKSRYLYHKALALSSNSNLETGEKIIQEAIKINPKNHEYYLLLGSLYLQEKDLNNAKLQFSKALEINPKSSVAKNNLGYVEELQNHIDLAKELYEKSVEINPVYTLGWINLGRIYLYNLNLPERANLCFHKAVEIDPNQWKTWFHLGNSYLALGDFIKAEESLRKALSINPNNPHILNNLGLIHFQMNDLETAKEFFEKATMLDPTLPDPIFNLGRVYKKFSMLDKAKEYFEKTLSIQPNYPGVQDELKTLEN